MSDHLFRRSVGLVAAAAILAVASAARAQATSQPGLATIRGVVRTSAGFPVAGALIELAAPPLEITTDAGGAFVLRVPAGQLRLTVTHQAWLPETIVLTVSGDLDGLEITLRPLARFTEDVVVAAIRAAPDAPVTKRTIDRTEIETLDMGQEMPFLLQQEPSLTQYSDSGGSTGYSYMYLRGIHQSRMNVTFDGVPLNEPEDSAFYFANFGDFANAVGSIQVQRGVGTSTVGAASFVGSINFASVDLTEDAQGTFRVGAGSFGARRIGATFNSGRVGPGIKLYAQAAYQDADGYRCSSGVAQRSLYFGATHDSPSSFLKVFGFVGHERTELSFLATDEATLATDPRFNALTPDERDSFGQRFISGHYRRAVGPSADLSVQAYYNGADGWYRIADAGAQPAGLFEYGLAWRTVGATASYQRTSDAWSLTWGGHVNDFSSRHAREAVGGAQDYTNQGFKNEVNSFLKLDHTRGRWHHYGDIQVRWTRFRYDGDVSLGSVDWAFVNPKLGTRVSIAPGLTVYGSVGRASREPGRLDLLQGEDNASLPYRLDGVKPETVVNLETGVEVRRGTFVASVNGYAMEFRNEIALTGELSETGLPTRRNVDRSFRRGVEVDVHWQPVAPVRIRHTAAYSYNRIRTWTQYYDVYDADGNWTDSVARDHTGVPPLLTPSVAATLSADYSPTGWATLAASGRYAGGFHLDNTGSARFTAPGFFVLDASAAFDLAPLLGWSRAEPRLRIRVDNLLNDDRLYPSGYSYQYFGGGTPSGPPDGFRYFYPLATRGVTVMLDFKL